MPSSTPKLLTPICEEIVRIQPNKTLDIGVGLGKWGMLVREYSEAYLNWRFTPDEWKCTVHGVEIHERYINDAHHVFYNHIYVMDVYKFLHDNVTTYDLILMVDVIEHIEKEKALVIIEMLKARGKNVIISYCNSNQGVVRDNRHEKHVSKWSVEDFNPKKVLYKGADWDSEIAAVLC
jgi:predicted TPR repeat methyltransferase